MKLRRLVVALLAAVLAFSGSGAGAQTPAPAVAPAQVQTLPNGLRVVVLEDHAAPVVQVATWYRFGSAYETPGKTGLAHGLEHMMFRGTSSLSSAGLDDVGARLGAFFNANTTDEYTHYYFVVPADRMEMMLRLEADRMRNIKLAAADWALEKQAVLQEWDQDYSQPWFRLIFGINEKVFPNSPFGKTALGVRKDIVNASVADLKRYYDQYYAPNNATVVITGDVTPAAAFAAARRWFGGIASRPLPAAHFTNPVPARGGTVAIKAEFPFEILDLAYALPGDNPATEIALNRALIALDALQNERGPVRKELVDNGLTLGMFVVPQTDRHASVAHAIAIVAPGHTIAEVRAAWDKIVAGAIANGLDPDFVAASKRSGIANLTYARDSVTGLGDDIGSGYVFPGDTDPAQAEALIAAITPAQTNDALKTYLSAPNVVGTLVPTTTDPSKAKGPTNLSAGVNDDFTGRVPSGPIVQPAWIRSELAKPLALAGRVTPQRFTLPNGLTLLVQEVHANPTVFIRGQIRGAVTFDPAGKEGLGDLTAGLLHYGSAKYDFDAQRKLSDDLAAELNFGSGFSAHGFAKDTATLLDALADDVQHPLFPAERFKLVQTQMLANANRRALQPEYRSNRAFLAALYPPDDPILRQDSPASLQALTLDDVRSFAGTYYRPDMTTLVVVGDVNADAVRTAVAAAFGGWSATGPKPDPQLPPIPLPKPVRKLVQTEARDDSVELGSPALARTNPDFDAFRLMNSVLGNGGFDSRLMDEVRTKRGLVYGISSALNAGRDRGTLTIRFRAVPAKVEAASSVVRHELRRLQTEPVSAAELQRQKVRLTASAAIAEQATSAIAGEVMNIATSELPLDYYATLAARYAKISAADVLRVAKTYLHPNNLVEVRTGPK